MPPELHSNLQALAPFIGTWQGSGSGEYPTIEPFDYVEEVTFSHVGKPFLIYGQKTRAAADGAPLHAETGYLRVPQAGQVELVLAHPNGITEIDHIVLLSPDLGRTVRSLAAVDVEPRRERDGELGGRPIRQVFFRFGAVIIEVVGPPETATEGLSTLWGITYTVADIDATAAFFGENTTRVKDAVQPGRRITTLHHRALGMSVRTAMISAPILGG